MKLGKPADERVIVTVKTVSRDDKEKGKDGKPNPRFGKMMYETYKSIDIFDATAAQVEKVVFDALSAKSEKK